MITKNAKQLKRLRRHKKIRYRIDGTGTKPRLCIYRSNKGMFLQVIDDQKGVTIASANIKEISATGTKTDKSFELGKLIAKKAIEKKVSEVTFDRGGYKYHGRIESAAKGAREGGLKF